MSSKKINLVSLANDALKSDSKKLEVVNGEIVVNYYIGRFLDNEGGRHYVCRKKAFTIMNAFCNAGIVEPVGFNYKLIDNDYTVKDLQDAIDAVIFTKDNN